MQRQSNSIEANAEETILHKLDTAHYLTNNSPAEKHGGGNAILWRGFPAKGTVRRVQIEGTTTGTK